MYEMTLHQLNYLARALFQWVLFGLQILLVLCVIFCSLFIFFMLLFLYKLLFPLESLWVIPLLYIHCVVFLSWCHFPSSLNLFSLGNRNYLKHGLKLRSWGDFPLPDTAGGAANLKPLDQLEGSVISDPKRGGLACMNLRELLIISLHPAPQWRQANSLAVHVSVVALLDSSEPRALGPGPHCCCFMISGSTQVSGQSGI